MNGKFELSNRVFQVVAVFLAVLAVYFGFQAYYDYKMLPENNIYPETVSITGEGKATISPDIAAVDLGITTEGAKVEAIVQENTDAMNKLLTDVKALGIADKDIKTKTYSLQPRYEYNEDGTRTSRGYTLSQSIEVKIRDFAKIGQVLETAANDGATNVSDLQFTIDDMEKARAEAREKAITQAKEKAKAIASQTGIKLKKITSVYEDTGACGSYGCSYTEGMGAGMTAKAVSSIAPTIQSGEQEVTVRITLNYRTK
ncbi:MAG: SIMPL domain-containing protein [Candidatus Pacebacteria bacterium]|nr:SIMPL domain-containing protein [Candidatus Paceibacterota bacterium]